MLEWILSLGACFWLPPVLWIALLLWARFLAYPLSLKKWIRRGKTWCYVPEWWAKTPLRLGVRVGLVLFAVLSAVSTSATVFWAVGEMPLPYFAVIFVACLLVEKPLTEKAMDGVYRLEVNAYFWEYRSQGEFYGKSGKPLSVEDLQGHAAWAFRNAMRKAEEEKRLFKHLKETAAREVSVAREEAAYEKA